jgi:integrase
MLAGPATVAEVQSLPIYLQPAGVVVGGFLSNGTTFLLFGRKDTHGAGGGRRRTIFTHMVAATRRGGNSFFPEVVKMGRKRRGRGEGSIYQEADGRWCGVISFGSIGGKRQREKVRADTKQGVLDQLDKLRREGPRPDCNGMTVAAYIDGWLEKRHADNKIGDTSLKRFRSLARTHLTPYWSHVRMDRLKREKAVAFDRFMIQKGVSASTRAVALRLLTKALNGAIKDGLLTVNPVVDLERPAQPDDEVQILVEDQLTRLLEFARRHQDSALLEVAAGSGLRIGELLGLSWGDIDLVRGTVEVRHTLALVDGQHVLKTPKTRAARRKIGLPQRALAALREHHERQDARGLLESPVFPTRSGRHQYASRVQKAFVRLLERAGLPRVRFHSLRHTHISMLLSKGMSVRAVATRAGHKNPTVTLSVYGHTLPNDDAVLVEALNQSFNGPNGDWLQNGSKPEG